MPSTGNQNCLNKSLLIYSTQTFWVIKNAYLVANFRTWKKKEFRGKIRTFLYKFLGKWHFLFMTMILSENDVSYLICQRYYLTGFHIIGTCQPIFACSKSMNRNIRKLCEISSEVPNNKDTRMTSVTYYDFLELFLICWRKKQSWSIVLCNNLCQIN